MTCQRFEELLLASLDSPLGAEDQHELDAHLEACPACVTRMQEHIIIARVLRELGAVEESIDCPPLPEHVVQRMLSAHQTAAAAPKLRALSG